MSRFEVPRLHAVTDDRILSRGRGFPPAARSVLRAGGVKLALHLRGPGTTGRHHMEVARELLPTARESGAALVINDRVDVALAVGAAGVHLGARSLPPDSVRGIVGNDVGVGVSVHTVAEAGRARDGGADYLFVGTIYASPSHPSVDPAGPELLREVSEAVEIPLVAIGGVEPARVREVTAAGAHGVASVSAVWDADDPAEAVERFLDALTDDPGVFEDTG